ncbi:MAG: hypothetical protein HY842_16945 [Bacteroidetes bacterium]|nr:hypothetical protein [Bacteroidota bacterium]
MKNLLPALLFSCFAIAAIGQHTISRQIYGHFSEHLGRCIYGGIYVGEKKTIANKDGVRNDVVEALRKMKIALVVDEWVSGRMLASGKPQDFNSFEQPEKVKPVSFAGATLKNGALTVKMPPASVVVLEVN